MDKVCGVRRPVRQDRVTLAVSVAIMGCRHPPAAASAWRRTRVGGSGNGSRNHRIPARWQPRASTRRGYPDGGQSVPANAATSAAVSDVTAATAAIARGRNIPAGAHADTVPVRATGTSVAVGCTGAGWSRSADSRGSENGEWESDSGRVRHGRIYGCRNHAARGRHDRTMGTASEDSLLHGTADAPDVGQACEDLRE